MLDNWEVSGESWHMKQMGQETMLYNYKQKDNTVIWENSYDTMLKQKENSRIVCKMWGKPCKISIRVVYL